MSAKSIPPPVDIINIAMDEIGPPSDGPDGSALLGELFLSCSAKRAYPVLWYVFPLRSRCDSVIRIACCLVIDITAEVAYILHDKASIIDNRYQ